MKTQWPRSADEPGVYMAQTGMGVAGTAGRGALCAGGRGAANHRGRAAFGPPALVLPMGDAVRTQRLTYVCVQEHAVTRVCVLPLVVLGASRCAPR